MCAPQLLQNEKGLYFSHHTEIAHVDGKRSFELYDVTVEREEDPRKRRVLRASILRENVEEYRRLWESASVALSSVLARYNVGNLSVSLYGSRIYIYYEYCGEQYEKDMASLRNDATVTVWKTATEALLTAREDGSVYEEFKQIFYSA